MLNQDIYLKAPAQNRLVNNGVAEVSEDHSESALVVLRYELETFVCDGQYQRGLETILQTFLRNLGSETEQPGVWISGFYGSGKSHLAKMLRTLWTDFTFTDGASARSLPKLPDAVAADLKELTTAGKRNGGLHAAAGKLGAGAGDNVRLALLGIVFKSKGLPEQYPQARFVLWLKQEGLFDKVETELKANGKTLFGELPHLYVSPFIAKALLKAYPELAESEAAVRAILKTQYPQVADISNDQMVAAVKDALSVDGKFPLTLMVLDEVQQYIGNDAHKAYVVQEVTETCCKHFSGKLLFVATGQTALSGMPNLQRLMGRFPVPVILSDADVERVIREIILAKKPSAQAEVDKVLRTNLGEISRHLRGTKLEHVTDDESVMVADYPILPVRRRFWERVLRTVDATGTVSQLRNQLRIVHEAVLASADTALGNVVPGDFLYDQISANLISTAAIPREVYEHIQKLAAGSESEQLKAKLLKLIYLVNKLPAEAVTDTGLRATLDILADLLVTDLHAGSSELRKRLPVLLDELQSKDRMVMVLEAGNGIEYRLQTRESSAWYEEYRAQEAEFKAAPQRQEQKRVDLFKQQIRTALNKVRPTQGKSNVARDLIISFDDSLPKDHATTLTLWIQDGWQTEEKSILAEARNKGAENPTLFLFIPDQYKTDLANAIVAFEAASKTIQRKGVPNTEEGRDALRSMESRQRTAEKEMGDLLDRIMLAAKLFQGGGQEVTDGNDLAEKVAKGCQASIVRLYREFDVADNPAWDDVYKEAHKGNVEALKCIGHQSEADKQPVCQKVMAYIGPGKKGTEIREHFKGAPFGWPQDAVDGALYALVSTGHVRATDAAGKPVDAKSLERTKLTQASFRLESVTISTVQLIKIRKLFQELAVPCQPNEELAKAALLLAKLRQLADDAGGHAPSPAAPDTQWLADIDQNTGNALLLALYNQADSLIASAKTWQATADSITKRRPAWLQLGGLLDHASALGPYQSLKAEQEAILAARSLLADPDPVRPLLDRATDCLRQAVNAKHQAYCREYQSQTDALAADTNWQKLSEDQRTKLTVDHHIETPAALDVSTAEKLQDALDACNLQRWIERTQALKTRFDSVRLDAARLLMPTVKRVALPTRTLNNPDEVKAWLAEAEAALLKQLATGPVIPG